MSPCALLADARHIGIPLHSTRRSTKGAIVDGGLADIIDSKTQEIRAEDGEVYTKMEDLADELPESSPRFILLSYPLTLPSGRLTVPYVLLYYLPVNCNPSMRMTYAGAVELMRNTAEVNRVIEVQEEDDILSIEAKLQGAD
ncbi:GMF family protein [Aspergillus clavatus NRRL 1]|uniref:GMF family protein n=1 Tax=Aspergillus clavatus (strain ATCC 1007 / CBS 513.65 / DSM 816 / NCTC 3887 / NRRL 1 / QM 1276 / 107) TaxID=344612 RepID=A1CB70_ASPCL|nr:GMF family protein [Aspergillus clavatus NRRL 1]EAW12988.1 GMF family protein [Aspergillus clavatus NRRL 1]